MQRLFLFNKGLSLSSIFSCILHKARGVGRILRKGGLTRGAICRRHYGRGSRDRRGVWGPIVDHDLMFLEWLVQLCFSFDSSFLFLLSFSLSSSPLPLFSSLFFLVGGGCSPLSPPPCLRPWARWHFTSVQDNGIIIGCKNFDPTLMHCVISE